VRKGAQAKLDEFSGTVSSSHKDTVAGPGKGRGCN
jgi:hypothetical protein